MEYVKEDLSTSTAPRLRDAKAAARGIDIMDHGRVAPMKRYREEIHG